MRHFGLLCSCLTAAFVMGISSPVARAGSSPHRYQNFHGSACQTGDAHIYSNAGISIPVTNSAQLFCPVSWSLDATTSPLLEIFFTVSWSSAPVAVPSAAPFNPNCIFLMNTSNGLNGGMFMPPLTSIIGEGTSTPTFVYHWKADPNLPPLVFYQNVIGSVLSCTTVPGGVVLNGYSVDSCLGPAGTNPC